MKWEIIRYLQGNLQEFIICTCDSPEAVLAVVKALLAANDPDLTHLVIRTRWQ